MIMRGNDAWKMNGPEESSAEDGGCLRRVRRSSRRQDRSAWVVGAVLDVDGDVICGKERYQSLPHDIYDRKIKVGMDEDNSRF